MTIRFGLIVVCLCFGLSLAAYADETVDAGVGNAVGNGEIERVSDGGAGLLDNVQGVTPTPPIPDFLPDETPVSSLEGLIKRDVVSGTLTGDYNGLSKGDAVEVIKDLYMGKIYVVSRLGRTERVQVPARYLYINPVWNMDTNQLSHGQLEAYLAYKQMNSDSPYFIWVDISRQRTYIFLNLQGKWQVIRDIPSATGTNYMPTEQGLFKVYSRQPILKGPQYAYNCLRFNGPYMIHSVTYTSRGNLLDPTLSNKASHGCVRVSIEDSRWLYQYIPYGTAVWVN